MAQQHRKTERLPTQQLACYFCHVAVYVVVVVSVAFAVSIVFAVVVLVVGVVVAVAVTVVAVTLVESKQDSNASAQRPANQVTRPGGMREAIRRPPRRVEHGVLN